MGIYIIGTSVKRDNQPKKSQRYDIFRRLLRKQNVSYEEYRVPDECRPDLAPPIYAFVFNAKEKIL